MNEAVPKNKILVAFSSGVSGSHRASLLQDLFDLNAQEAEENIVKNLWWSTRYYKCSFDLYVDEFEGPEEWLAELGSQEFDELREVLAGVIVVTDYDSQDPSNDILLQKFAVCGGKGTFNVWYNTKANNEPKSLDANRKLRKENTEAEMVDWHCDREVNEFGEKLGLARLKEIIDIHEWDHIAAPSSQAAAGRQCRLDSFDDFA